MYQMTHCHTSMIYAGAVNDVLEEQERRLKFTMHTDDDNWYHLWAAAP